MKRVRFSTCALHVRTVNVSGLVGPGWDCHYSHTTTYHRRQGLQLSMETLIPVK